IDWTLPCFFRVAFCPALFQVTRGDERRGGNPHSARANRADAVIIKSPQSQEHHAEWMTGLFALAAFQFAQPVEGFDLPRPESVRRNNAEVIQSPVTVLVGGQIISVAVA